MNGRERGSNSPSRDPLAAGSRTSMSEAMAASTALQKKERVGAGPAVRRHPIWVPPVACNRDAAGVGGPQPIDCGAACQARGSESRRRRNPEGGAEPPTPASSELRARRTRTDGIRQRITRSESASYLPASFAARFCSSRRQRSGPARSRSMGGSREGGSFSGSSKRWTTP